MPSPHLNTGELDTLRNDSSSWANTVGYAPAEQGQAVTDVNLQNRYIALLSLHAQHHPEPKAGDEELLLYILDQETRYHQAADHYRTAISLAVYLLARYRKPQHFWPIWVAREASYDTSKLVDVHFMYYATGGLNGATDLVKASGEAEITAGVAAVGSGRAHYWKWLVEENHDGDVGKAVKDVQAQALERIESDRKSGVDDAKVIAFVESSWRTDTNRWGESVLPEEYP